MMNDDLKRDFARRCLPWIVFACGIAVYALTLNRSVTQGDFFYVPGYGWLSGGANDVALIGSYDWRPVISPPVFYVVTLPFRLLPTSFLPVALNFFAAVCGALTLALLGRSVALLPHDRTHEQREREHHPLALLSLRSAWLPPLFAVILCGLQLTFWQNATAASREIFDLLLFSYAIRCLLEYRLDENPVWLRKCAVVFGAAIAENWSMIGFLPLFLVALVWMRGPAYWRTGAGFVDWKFVGRIALWGLLGLSFYFVMPIVFALMPDAPGNFWTILRTQFGEQKFILTHLPYKSLWIITLCSLLPVAVIGIKWTSSFGDSSPMGAKLASFAFHVVHAVFFLVCIWVAFDPPFSPRRFAPQFGVNLPFLKLYYLGALAVGYFAGYFLLVFGQVADRRRPQPTGGGGLRAAVNVALWALLILLPIAMVWKNFPQIRLAKSSFIRDYGRLAVESLPKSKALVLSDDVAQLYLFHAALDQRRSDQQYILLNTSLLRYPGYFRFLQNKYGKSWSDLFPEIPTQVLGDAQLIDLLSHLVAQHPTYYLHPSFGYYFERFHLEPHGVIYELKALPQESVVTPPLTPQIIDENNSFWVKTENIALGKVIQAITPANPMGTRQKILRAFHLIDETDRTASLFASFYSRALNFWGIELQKNRRLDEAGRCFARAMELNPENVMAKVNLVSNEKIRTSADASIPLTKSVEDELGQYRTWQQAMNNCGFFDEPNRCLEQAKVFSEGRLHKQAAQQLERVRALAPNNLSVRLRLVQFYSMANYPESALEMINELQPQIASGAIDSTNAIQLRYLEAVAHFKRNDTQKGSAALQRVLSSFRRDDPSYEGLLTAATRLYMGAQDFTNALRMLDEHLSIAPTNSSALINKGVISLRLKDYPSAIDVFNRAISIEPTNYLAVFNRAVANLQAGNEDAAERDYKLLEQILPQAPQTDFGLLQVYFGLAQIAEKKSNAPLAIQYYQRYLSNAAPANPENQVVLSRLKELRTLNR
jgi:tetratricopeptide (TPR) repeat protein